jgi:hypothetical protein
MKNRAISGIGAIIAGLLVSFGPQYLFKVCEPMMGGRFMKCHWTAQGEIGVGILIAALGVLLLIFKSGKTRFGLSVAASLTGFLVLSLPHALIGGCESETMPCRSMAFPTLTVLGILVIVGCGLNAFYIQRGRIE